MSAAGPPQGANRARVGETPILRPVRACASRL
jgi:hypothetical protein